MLIYVLLSILILLLFYILSMKQQLRTIQRQLMVRQHTHQNQPLHLQLLHRQLNTLVASWNDVLAHEQQLRQASVRQENYYKEFVSNISHDFRTPLTAIKGSLQLLDVSALDAAQQQKHQIALAHVARLEALLHSFFEYAYVMNQQQTPPLKPVQVDALLTEAIAAHYAAFEQQKMRIEFATIEENVWLLSDDEWLSRIFDNLLQNSLSHSAETLTISLQTTESQCIMTFENPLLQPLKQPPEILFERFYHEQSQSTGLGLAIVRKLTEQLGGHISATATNDSLHFALILPFDKSSSFTKTAEM